VLEKVDEIRKAALQACSQASSVKDLEQARVRFLGKKGELTLLLRSTGQLPRRNGRLWQACQRAQG
jgi:phenylalanyl-tRNA synthetase alpha chain